MVDRFLKKVQYRVRSPCVKLNLVPKLSVKILFYAQQILLINVSAHELVDKGAVKIVVFLFGGYPKFGVDGEGLEQH